MSFLYPLLLFCFSPGRRSGGRASDLLVLQEPLRRLRLEVAVAGGSRRDHAEGFGNNEGFWCLEGLAMVLGVFVDAMMI